MDALSQSDLTILGLTFVFNAPYLWETLQDYSTKLCEYLPEVKSDTLALFFRACKSAITFLHFILQKMLKFNLFWRLYIFPAIFSRNPGDMESWWAPQPWKYSRRGRLNTVDLLVLNYTSLDQLLSYWKYNLLISKQATLMRRSTVLSLPSQLEFPSSSVSKISIGFFRHPRLSMPKLLWWDQA